ncbi:ATPase/histidine kinase/DNA gyrase B/HSP90 domain protein [Striga asiatica]|uniref:ATPase/histidine kinase/DNA gyrase B/HSP90 domain protein n=1 Tax=Striga asiatica TaxID=4170 RepID=A0A5A7PDB0_STRAF|nr:ATPase/histidine kinase/DNA gyrase B/HSP90 domain protein [Striga asiatica]
MSVALHRGGMHSARWRRMIQTLVQKWRVHLVRRLASALHSVWLLVAHVPSDTTTIAASTRRMSRGCWAAGGPLRTDGLLATRGRTGYWHAGLATCNVHDKHSQTARKLKGMGKRKPRLAATIRTARNSAAPSHAAITSEWNNSDGGKIGSEAAVHGITRMPALVSRCERERLKAVITDASKTDAND